MNEILTAQQLAQMYDVGTSTIQTYIDGFRLARFRKSYYSIEWCCESKLIVEELLRRRKRKTPEKCLTTRVKYLEEEVNNLKNIIAKLLKDREDIDV